MLVIVMTVLCATPLALRVAGQKNISRTIKDFKSAESEDNAIEAKFDAAREYNLRLKDLWQGMAVGHPIDETKAPFKDGEVIGTLKIQKIYVDLPIFNGTSADALSSGAGLLEKSSYPTGENGCHSVITGHSGLPGAAMLTRLDELKKGDEFEIGFCGKTYTYKVREITVTEPDAVITDIDKDEDKVSLVTCTPYGLNTHRLVVTGYRAKGASLTSAATKRAFRLSAEEAVIIIIPCVAGALTVSEVVALVKAKKGEKDEKI